MLQFVRAGRRVSSGFRAGADLAVRGGMGTDSEARRQQERAQKLAAKGDVNGAAAAMDGWLSEHDGDWGCWLYLAGLLARLGRRDEAVAAYRVSARQLEEDGLLVRAVNALRAATRLRPQDTSVWDELRRLELVGEPKTEWHLAIFDIIDAERAA